MLDTVDCSILKKYDIIKKIGQGAYGQVWKVKHKPTTEILALKRIYDVFRNSIDAQRTYREIMYMRLFDHPNIVKLHSCHRPSTEKDIYITMEYMEADLSSAIKHSVLKDNHKQFIFYQICNAVLYLHSGDLLHRDLKPANVLLNAKCQVKLCDFGLVRTVNKANETELLTENVATRWYRAPQVLLGSRVYGKSADIWSLGVILGEVISGKPIIQGESTLNQLQKIIQLVGRPSPQDFYAAINDHQIMAIYQSLPNPNKKTFKELFPNADPQAVNLLSLLLQFSPLKRPSIEQVMNHEYIAKFRGKLEEKTLIQPFKIENDLKKLKVEQYRTLIYQQIDFGSRESQISTTSSNKQLKQTISSPTNHHSNKIFQSNNHPTNPESPNKGNYRTDYSPFTYQNYINHTKYSTCSKPQSRNCKTPIKTSPKKQKVSVTSKQLNSINKPRSISKHFTPVHPKDYPIKNYSPISNYHKQQSKNYSPISNNFKEISNSTYTFTTTFTHKYHTQPNDVSHHLITSPKTQHHCNSFQFQQLNTYDASKYKNIVSNQYKETHQSYNPNNNQFRPISPNKLIQPSIKYMPFRK